MKKYKVKRPMHFLSKVNGSVILPSYVRTCCNGRYEILTNKVRFYEGTTVAFIRG